MNAISAILHAFLETGARSLTVTRHGAMVFLETDEEIAGVAESTGVAPQTRSSTVGVTWQSLDVRYEDSVVTYIGPEHREAP